MSPVLMLCSAAFAIAAGFHVLAMVGALQTLSNGTAVALFCVVLAGFVASILTHPKSESQGGQARLSLVHCFKALKPPARIAYGVLLAYGFVAAIASAPMKQGRNKVPLAELVQAPYFFTAFLLIFATCALLGRVDTLLDIRSVMGKLRTRCQRGGSASGGGFNSRVVFAH